MILASPSPSSPKSRIANINEQDVVECSLLIGWAFEFGLFYIHVCMWHDYELIIIDRVFFVVE